MSMCRSSIFSFDTLRWSETRPVGMVRAVALALCLIVTAESAARLTVGSVDPYWQYWNHEAGASFAHYRKLTATGKAPSLVIVGDSTAHGDFDPNVLSRICGSPDDLWNIGCSGNFAVAFKWSTLPLLREPTAAPRIIVASFNSPSFFRDDSPDDSEASILSCQYCQQWKSGRSLADYFCLARVWPCLQLMVHKLRGWNAATVLEAHGFMLQKGRRQLNRRPEPLTDQEMPRINLSRLLVIRELAQLAQNRNIRLVLVVPPTQDTSARRRSMNAEYTKAVRRMSSELGFLVIDAAEIVPFQPAHFFDRNHLNADGAQLLSQVLIREMESARNAG